jgi:hypothetical protein
MSEQEKYKKAIAQACKQGNKDLITRLMSAYFKKYSGAESSMVRIKRELDGIGI